MRFRSRSKETRLEKVSCQLNKKKKNPISNPTIIIVLELNEKKEQCFQ